LSRLFCRPRGSKFYSTNVTFEYNRPLCAVYYDLRCWKCVGGKQKKFVFNYSIFIPNECSLNIIIGAVAVMTILRPCDHRRQTSGACLPNCKQRPRMYLPQSAAVCNYWKYERSKLYRNVRYTNRWGRRHSPLTRAVGYATILCLPRCARILCISNIKFMPIGTRLIFMEI